MMVHEATLAGALAAEVAVVHLAVAMELGWVRGSWAGLKVAWETLADLAVARVVVAEAMGVEEAMAPEMVMAPQVVDVVAEATEAGQEAATGAAGMGVVAMEGATAVAAMEVAMVAMVSAEEAVAMVVVGAECAAAAQQVVNQAASESQLVVRRERAVTKQAQKGKEVSAEEACEARGEGRMALLVVLMVGMGNAAHSLHSQSLVGTPLIPTPRVHHHKTRRRPTQGLQDNRYCRHS